MIASRGVQIFRCFRAVCGGNLRVGSVNSCFSGSQFLQKQINFPSKSHRSVARSSVVLAAAGSKKKIVFQCTECGHQALRDGGQCPNCNEWACLERREIGVAGVGGGAGLRASLAFESGEEIDYYSQSSASPRNRGAWILSGGSSQSLKSIIEQRGGSTNKINLAGKDGAEMSRVLGGGVVEGSLILVGGDPGVGKSTLLLQVAGMLALPDETKPESSSSNPTLNQQTDRGRVLYVSAEESVDQIVDRALRLGLGELDNISVQSETRLEMIIKDIQAMQPLGVVIDSIQAVFLSDANGSAGSLSQIRECGAALVHVAKSSGIPIFIIGHVTKDGNIAGPKALEHIVDVVLYLEGERHQFYRILRGRKNRFGPTEEIGVFEMDDTGMHAVENPSAMFLRDRRVDPRGVGSGVAVIINGTRPLLLEVQALCTPVSRGQKEARFCNVGVDNQRLLLLRGVLEKYVGLKMYSINLHVNVVGGMMIKDTAGDLAVAVAIASAYLDKPVASDVAVVGELGLGGELRPVIHLEKRIFEVGKLGFKRCIVPKVTGRRRSLPTFDSLEITECSTIGEAVEAILGVGTMQAVTDRAARRRKRSGKSRLAKLNSDELDGEWSDDLEEMDGGGESS